MTEKRKLTIAGIHHISIKARGLEQMEKTVDFYHNILGMEIVRRWGQGDSSACMVDAGNCLLEIMASGQADEDGVVNHLALATDQVSQWIELIRGQGYPITMEPQDKTLASQPPVPIRVAFFRGPAGELVELMEERKE